jgi:hypothetical protein
MEQEIKQCQNCKKDFITESEDFDFYEKIKVPPPTFCPECRFQRRLSFLNLTTLYKRQCDLCKKEVVSTFAPGTPYVIYCPKCWWSDNWDFYSYGRDYDFSKPFFEQWEELHRQVPMAALSTDHLTLINSEYTNHAGHSKNCYLIFQADFNEDCSYGVYLKRNTSMIDCSNAMASEWCYDCMHLFKSNRCIGGMGNVTETLEGVFLRDCDNCQNCFASANLRNKKYYIFNEPYTKEGYFEEIKKWDLGSYKIYQEVKRLAGEHWKTLPPRPLYDDFSANSTGSYVFQSKNCKKSFDVSNAEDSKYLFMLSLAPIKDCYDVSAWGNNMNLVYEATAVGENISGVRFCDEAGLSLMDAEYSKMVFGGSHIFGCVGVRKGEYCILNKRYSEQEFKKLREKIVAHMDNMPYTDKRGRVYKYGDFFPVDFSPFPYNDTLAQRFFPISSEQATQEHYHWKEQEKSSHAITKQVEELPDHIKDASQSILSEVIGCKTCGRGYRITSYELEFLRRMNLPLPRQCPFCRIKGKIEQWVKELRMIDRVCSKCGKQFQTHYPTEDVEYILCKQCYQHEVA